ncbi:polyamine aminopropyltransferase [Acuticoccus sp. I52.16.1]|uniref:polyamine aminopropyltransferase n=1 Tax=Acuticoccus sp. I52.16.1 TaxID=2928472 RepID=UPI001FD52562|nr:polyamine aminopropyltransferase [Acuticoccus sp. I52.16.1]UOM34843.1 polyamine aminopropyltransferase [Acuticoccus sp. I52.16.1]
MPDWANWVTETVNDEAGFRTSLRVDKPVRTVDGEQALAVFDNPSFGRVLTLDGTIQVTTGDEFVYHEMMSHVALFAHGGARDVLILGGGDGGVAREVLRHPVASLTLVEIDRAVVDLMVAEVPSVSAGAFDDPRLSLVIEDGAAFVRDTKATYDIIVVDAPDPIGPGAALFTDVFYTRCRRVLRPGGVMVCQSGMPFLAGDWLRGHAATLRHVFDDVSFFLSTVPSYTGGPMAHAFATSDPALKAVKQQALEERALSLDLAMRYWTPAVHRAAFALPPYIAERVAPS